ncbi:hypothetical protein RM697_08120 [Ichthyenterobacterium sp. W332]|uniref:Lipoprotein SmpA/OmlA domain-containing protein n=1 Tax=Microcosmobacter mediterraneus TaxID=3075607 RepID=A0ABU2YKA9_9FLAO|nr:hypothetical protein [Ichthyenterobacterium sp. W332]MDT0558608.1 hypothetical protein [Ichthyenterobacterium sp. W332]
MLLKLKRGDKIGIFFFVAFVISTSLIYLFEEQFVSYKWKTEQSRRYKMVDDLIESQTLIGLSKQEVLVLLGQPNTTILNKKDAFVYNIGKQPSFVETKREHLLVIFINNHVDDVTLAFE